jgi:hypothetical protein
MKTIKGLKIKTEPPHDDGDGSVVLKGFRVPQGYVLYIQSKTGGTRTVQTGEFSGGKAKFVDVQSGAVPGWTLQQISAPPQTAFETEQPEPNSPQPENTNEYIPEPQWGSSEWIGASFIVPAPMFKKFQRLGKMLGDYPDDKALRSFLKSNPEWVQLIQGYQKEIKDKANIHSGYLSSSNGASTNFSRGASSVNLHKIVSGIVEDILATPKNYELMSKLLSIQKEKGLTDAQMGKFFRMADPTQYRDFPEALASHKLTATLDDTLKYVTGEKTPEKAQSAPKAAPYKFYDDDTDDDYDDPWSEDYYSDAEEEVLDRGGRAFVNSLVSMGSPEVGSEMYHFYNDVKAGSESGRSINMEERLSHSETKETFMTVTPQQYDNDIREMTKQEAETLFAPIIGNFFMKTDAGDYVSKTEVLAKLKEQIDTLPDEEKFLLQKQIYLPDMASIQIEDIASIMESIKSTGYGYDKVITPEELDAIAPVTGRAIEVDDFPRVSVEGMSYQQARFEILGKLLSPTSYAETFKDMGSDYVAASQPFSDFASEVIKDYIEYLGGDSDLAYWLFSDYVLDNNTVKNSISAITMRMIEAENQGKDYTQNTPSELLPPKYVLDKAQERLDKARPTYQAVKSAHQALFKAIYPEGTKVGRVYIVDSPTDEEVPRFSLDMAQVSSFSTADREYLLDTFNASTTVHRPGGKTAVYVTTHVKQDNVVMMPNFFADQSHWRKKPDGSRYMVIRQTIPNRNFAEEEIMVTSKNCITSRAELKQAQGSSSREFTILEAEVRLI